MKYPEVNFLPFRIPALDSKIGAEETAANTMSYCIPPLRKSISPSSNSAGSGLTVPGRITQS